MKNKLFALIFLFVSLFTFAAQEISGAEIIVQVEARVMDRRAKILQAYLEKYNSPMQNYAQDFIDAADANNMDWKWIPAIAGVESTFGKYVPGGQGPYTSYNAWGWGVYGTQALGFESWRDGIFTVSEGLKTGYLDKGLTDPYSMNRKYASSGTWGQKVDFFMKDLDKFAKEYEEQIPDTDKKNFVTGIAGISAQLALR